MGFRLYEATIKIDDADIKKFQYWSQYPAKDKRNMVECAQNYMKDFGKKRKIQVLESKMLNYNAMKSGFDKIEKIDGEDN